MREEGIFNYFYYKNKKKMDTNTCNTHIHTHTLRYFKLNFLLIVSLNTKMMMLIPGEFLNKAMDLINKQIKLKSHT